MTGRLVAVAAVLLAALPAGAAAQAPDERAAARAFADASARFMTTMELVGPQIEAALDTAPPACVDRLTRGMPERHSGPVEIFAGVSVLAGLARAVGPPLLAFSAGLHAVETSDPALRSGRTAWRRARRAYVLMAPYADIDVCAEIRRYIDRGHRPTPPIRGARSLLRSPTLGDEFDRRIARAVERLQELGIPEDEAEQFQGDVSNTSGGGQP